MRVIYLMMLLIFSFISNAQLRNNVWCFGDSAGIDFNSSIATPIYSSLDTRGSCASIADTAGNLLFYANTRAGVNHYSTQVRSWDHNLMENGDSIIGQGWYNELLIVLAPQGNDIYFLFSIGVVTSYGLYYSIIDMNQNMGLGKVVEKNKLIYHTAMWDMLAAIKHGNGRDWWVISKPYNLQAGSDSMIVCQITPDTIICKFQSIGTSIFGNAGNLTFSPDGSKLLFTAWNGLIELFDFDRCSGILSNPISIYHNNPQQTVIFGSAFSPDGNIIYYSSTDAISNLVQLDLTAVNIFGSRDTIASYNGPFDTGGSLRLAPDNKIYWSCAWTNGINFNYPYRDTMYHVENMNLSVVNDPNVLGTGCNFGSYSFYLGGKRCYWGLPNNPDYDMGPLFGSACDTLHSTITELSDYNIEVYPNPFSDYLKINNSGIYNITSICIYDPYGKAFVKKIHPVVFENIVVRFLTPGSYFIEFNLNNSLRIRKKLLKM